MSFNQFIIECNSRYIDISCALENNNIINALKDKDIGEVIRILDTEF